MAATAFDPTQPVTILTKPSSGGFDPSKPIEILGGRDEAIAFLKTLEGPTVGEHAFEFIKSVPRGAVSFGARSNGAVAIRQIGRSRSGRGGGFAQTVRHKLDFGGVFDCVFDGTHAACSRSSACKASFQSS